MSAHTLRGDSQGNIWYTYFTGVDAERDPDDSLVDIQTDAPGLAKAGGQMDS